MNHDGEIRTLLARITQLGDRGSTDAYLALFRDDAVVTIAANERRGSVETSSRGLVEIRAAVTAQRAAGMIGPGSDTRHLLTTTALTIDDDEHATTESVFQFMTNTSTTPTAGGSHSAPSRLGDDAVADKEGGCDQRGSVDYHADWWLSTLRRSLDSWRSALPSAAA